MISDMRRYLVFVIAVVLMFIGFLVWLMTANVPAPTHHVEQVIPNDRLGR
jgi:hypothetical protein